MKTIEQLIVSLILEGKEIPVGELVSDSKKIYFKYYPSFIEQSIEISPFKLPVSKGIFTPDTTIFDGLFGVFNDSLPDGWGRLLMDRTLLERGVSLSEINPLDRLAFVGENGTGALVYQPCMEVASTTEIQVKLDHIAAETKKVLAGVSTDIVETLFRLGGSSGGARPKIQVGYNKMTNHLIYGADQLPIGYDHWLIKFPSSNDSFDIAEIEFAYHKMAIDAGIHMSECQLFQGASGRQYFGTKRFDRIGNKRLHMHSAAGLLHDNFRLSSMDYGHLMDATFQLEKQVVAYEKILRLAAFNVFSHNRDDHSKNVSFLMNGEGKWQLAPAYDLTYSISAHGFHSTLVAGEGRSPSSKHLIELADVFGISHPKTILEEVKTITNNWRRYATENGVSEASTKKIEQHLLSIS